jgi:hypothetical protein
VDVAGALAVPGVDCVVTSEDARRWTRPFAVAVKTAMEQWCLAIDRVRYYIAERELAPKETGCGLVVRGSGNLIVVVDGALVADGSAATSKSSPVRRSTTTRVSTVSGAMVFRSAC